MKKILYVVLTCIVAAASYAATSAASDKSAPQGGAATVVTKDVDLGEADKGKIFEYKIEVKNTGKEDLIVENVYSSCGCLEVTDKRWPNNVAAASVSIKPSHSIYIDVKLDTNKVFGQFEKILHVISNDPEKKDTIWKIKGNVAAASYAAPLAAQGAAVTTEVKLAAQDAIMLMVFYSPGCNECKDIMENYLPKIKEKYGDKIAVVNYNIENYESFAFLLDLQNKYDERAKKGRFFNPKPPAVFVNNELLYGVKEIKERLENEIK